MTTTTTTTSELKSNDDGHDGHDEQKSSSSYGFGVRFSYYNPKFAGFGYCKPIHANLRQELLENKIYRITEFDYGNLLQRATEFSKTIHGKKLKAQSRGGWNKLASIIEGELITVDHIISVMVYTNFDELQRAFKTACRRSSSHYTTTETSEDLVQNHRNICIWARLIFEAIYFYGQRLQTGQTFFHGINCRLMFDEFCGAEFSCPTSTTASRQVAYSFAKEDGVIIEMGKGSSKGATYLDVSTMSDYPNEEERLFFKGTLGFHNVIYDCTSNKKYIKALKLFQKISKGSFFAHTSLVREKYQLLVGQMMENMMMMTESDSDSDFQQEIGEDVHDVINGIPLYMQQLFSYFAKQLKQLWINREEFAQLNLDLQRYLCHDGQVIDGKFAKYMERENGTQLKHSFIHTWKISAGKLMAFWNGEQVTSDVFGTRFQFGGKGNGSGSGSAEEEVNNVFFCLLFRKSSAAEDGVCRFDLKLTSIPESIAKIEFVRMCFVKKWNLPTVILDQ